MRVGRVDVVDDTFVRGAAEDVRAALDARGLPDPGATGWPRGCGVGEVEDRGPKGVRWVSTGRLVGSMEIWLEPVPGGTLVHHYVRGAGRHPWRSPATLARDHTVGWKRLVHEVKDEIEGRAQSAG